LRRLSYAEEYAGWRQEFRAFAGLCAAGWIAPDITSGQGSLRDWSRDDIAAYLKTGHNKSAAATGLMAEVVDLSTSKLSDADVGAIATYLKEVSGPAQNSSSSPDNDTLTAGGAIHQDLCPACHRLDGKGVPNMVPNLAEATTVKAKDPTTVLRVIQQGADSFDRS
jgi:mono/diheme cytochrome c family protein